MCESLKLCNRYNKMIQTLSQQRKDEFMASFEKINSILGDMYRTISNYNAELELVDSFDPFSEGVNFTYVFTIHHFYILINRTICSRYIMLRCDFI